MRIAHGIVGLAIAMSMVAPNAVHAGIQVIDFQDLPLADVGSQIGGADGRYAGFQWQDQPPGKFTFVLARSESDPADLIALTEFEGTSGNNVRKGNTFLYWEPTAEAPFFQFQDADFAPFLAGPGSLVGGRVVLTGYAGHSNRPTSVVYYTQGDQSGFSNAVTVSLDEFRATPFDRIEVQYEVRGAGRFPGSPDSAWLITARMDDLKVAGAIPEPSSYGLMALGLAAVAWGARRRSRS